MANFTVEIYENDLVWLAFAAGIATGQGNEVAAESLYGILNRLEPILVDDVPQEFTTEAQLHTEQQESPGLRLIDPDFTPPVPAPPVNRQDDFGSGPPPASL